MKHVGDITKLNGAELEAVDCVCGGSPCQNFSLAGNRKGLGGDESVLFYQQVRVVKELRENDKATGRTGRFVRPRYMVWENVPGALSSPGGNRRGEDFAAVLEEIVRIEEPNAPAVSVPNKGWPKAGCLYDVEGRWSVAWRVHDAQFWGGTIYDADGVPIKYGTPQRRRRIALVADLGGLTAPEILFERKGLRGNPASGRKEGQTVTADAESSVGADDRERDGVAFGFPLGFRPENVRLVDETATTICNGTRPGFTTGVVTAYGISSYDSNAMKSSNPHSGIYKAETSRTLDLNGGNPACNQGGIVIVEEACVDGYNGDLNEHNDMLVAGLDCRNGRENGDLCGTLQSKPNGGFSYNCIHPVRSGFTARRLTPLECERLQGYPDGWTDIGDWVDSKGKKHKAADSPRYKALGNSIALPFWQWLIKRISAQYERDATMGSLFDGIGGFPYCWERVNGKGSARWASEIEEFPMAVTKVRFGDR